MCLLNCCVSVTSFNILEIEQVAQRRLNHSLFKEIFDIITQMDFNHETRSALAARLGIVP
jgi:hypothetical protein